MKPYWTASITTLCVTLSAMIVSYLISENMVDFQFCFLMIMAVSIYHQSACLEYQLKNERSR